MCKKDKTQIKQIMKSSPIYNSLQHYLIEHACTLYMNISYINRYKLNKTREWRKEQVRERKRDGLVMMVRTVVLLVN
jgi:hypothetical protein